MLFLHRIRRYFRERSRNIFHFHDGSKQRRGDPIMIGTKLEEVCPDYIELLEMIGKDATKAPVGAVRDDLITQKREASVKLAEASRQAFGVKPLTDTEGLTQAECIHLLTDYFLFMERLARDAELFPDSPDVE